MSCSRNKKTKLPEVGRHQCQACGQVRKKSAKLCKPKRIKKLGRARALQTECAHKRAGEKK